MMKKTKMGIFKVYYFASGTYSLAFKVYLKYVNCIFSYTLPCFVCCGENEKTASSLHWEYGTDTHTHRFFQSSSALIYKW